MTDRRLRWLVTLVTVGAVVAVGATIYRVTATDVGGCATVSSGIVPAGEEPTEFATERCPEQVADPTRPPHPVPTEESEPDTAEPTESPDLGEAPVEPDETEVLVLARRSLEDGTIVYSSPHEMTVGETGRVLVRIVRGSDASGITDGVLGPIEQEPVDVGARMKATLVGPAFDVVPIGEPIQALLDDDYAEWQWHVTPTDGGRRELVLTVAALHEDTAVAQVTKVRTITVDVDRGGATLNWFGRNWIELLQAGGVSGMTIGGAGVAWVRRRRRQAGSAVLPT